MISDVFFVTRIGRESVAEDDFEVRNNNVEIRNAKIRKKAGSRLVIV